MTIINRLDLHHLYFARFVLEAQSAFSIASGLSDGAFDNLVVRDANHLPAIPATTLSGVLRHMYREKYGKENEAELFGFQEKAKGIASRIEISWGFVHDSCDQPVELLQVKINDPVLQFLAQDHPIYRNRVRINDKGAADHQAKYDVTVAPKGCRFSFEICLWTTETNSEEWDRLLELITSPELRLGASVRSGLGRFACIRLQEKVFNLKNTDDYKAFSRLSSDLTDTDGWTDKQQQIDEENPLCELWLSLKPEDFWRFGQGNLSLTDTQDKPSDAMPYTESVISWKRVDDKKTESACLKQQHVLIPGSAVKGVIRHRFFYHYARQLLEKHDDSVVAEKALAAANLVFGFAADTVDGNTMGQAGIAYFSDCYLSREIFSKENVQQMTHTSIDRFTGGVRSGALFTEELIWKSDFELRVSFDSSKSELFDDMTRTALMWTFDDLNQGRLALGAASNRGHGYFSGAIEWRGNPLWSVKQQETAV